jgi:D-alanyl-D-alanine endopeptidase (penicillin-binding protein 7)
MPFKQKIHQRFFSLIIVIILFALIGLLLYAVGKNNKEKTDALTAAVFAKQIKDRQSEQIKQLNSIYFNASSTAEVTAKSFLTLVINSNGIKKVINEKNSDMVLPIASLTKLMLAVIAVENLDLQTEVIATKDYIEQEGSFNILEANKKYKLKELLVSALIASDNDSARLIASTLGTENIVGKMNSKAESLGLNSTKFSNVTGLDPKNAGSGVNSSTVSDLANLAYYITKKHPQIFALTTNATYNFCDVENYCKEIKTTNKILEENKMLYNIVGGKTGSTDLAQKNLILIINPVKNISLINIVLGSKDSFADTLFLINNLNVN